MNIKEATEIMQKIQSILLNFLDKEYDAEENFENFLKIIEEHNLQNNKYYLNSLFHFIVEIANNHNRCTNFFEKIEKIMQFFKGSIKQYYSNSQIFNIFQSNKRLLLYLIEEGIMKFDDYIINKITTEKMYKKMKYIRYFYPELKTFIVNKKCNRHKLNEKKLFNNSEDYSDYLNNEYSDNDYDGKENDAEEDEMSEDFYKNRRAGENQDYISTIIQKDLIEEFIIYINKNNYPLKSTIMPSIYETNSFLLNIQSKAHPTLIEYASFYGSIQIFNYLRLNDIKLTSSLWLYAVHSNNAELFNLLEENHVKIKDKSYRLYFDESIKCHHIDFANYILNNYLQSKEDNMFDYDTTIKALEYHNFAFINSFYICQSSFYYLCKYDYSFYVDLLFKSFFIDLNHVIKNINDKDIYYMPALHIAIEEENIEMVKLLLSRKEIDINVKNNDITPFHLAFKKNNVEIIETLLENDNIDINELNKSGNDEKTALFIAVEKEDIELVKLLLAKEKLNVNLFNKCGKDCLQSAFYLAVEKENIEIIKLLLSNEKIDLNILNKTRIEKEEFQDENEEDEEENEYNETNEDSYQINIKTALYRAVEKENIEIVKLLLSNEKVNINGLNTEEYITASYKEKDLNEPNYYEYSSGEKYTKYNEVHESITKYAKTALYLAVDIENIEIIKLLLARDDIDVNILNKSGVDKARKNVYHSGMIRNSERANVCTFENTAFHNAVKKGNIDIVKLLLSTDQIDVNQLDKKFFFKKKRQNRLWINEWEIKSMVEKTALHIAVENDYYEIVKLLLQVKWINDEARDNNGNRPVDYAKNNEIKSLFNK